MHYNYINFLTDKVLLKEISAKQKEITKFNTLNILHTFQCLVPEMVKRRGSSLSRVDVTRGTTLQGFQSRHLD
jgi:hypothetical protein